MFDISLGLEVGQINLMVLLILFSHALCWLPAFKPFYHLLHVVMVDEESSYGEGENHKVEERGEVGLRLLVGKSFHDMLVLVLLIGLIDIFFIFAITVIELAQWVPWVILKSTVKSVGHEPARLVHHVAWRWSEMHEVWLSVHGTVSLGHGSLALAVHPVHH